MVGRPGACQLCSRRGLTILCLAIVQASNPTQTSLVLGYVLNHPTFLRSSSHSYAYTPITDSCQPVHNDFTISCNSRDAVYFVSSRNAWCKRKHHWPWPSHNGDRTNIPGETISVPCDIRPAPLVFPRYWNFPRRQVIFPCVSCPSLLTERSLIIGRYKGGIARIIIMSILSVCVTVAYFAWSFYLWTHVSKFGLQSECNNEVKYIFFFASVRATVPWLQRLWLASLSISTILMAVALVVALAVSIMFALTNRDEPRTGDDSLTDDSEDTSFSMQRLYVRFPRLL